MYASYGSIAAVICSLAIGSKFEVAFKPIKLRTARIAPEEYYQREKDFRGLPFSGNSGMGGALL